MSNLEGAPRENATSSAEILHMPQVEVDAQDTQPQGELFEATAGSLLKQARVDRGMHLATVAAALKVPLKKLEALENNQFELLPDLPFTRALAASVCRHLKIDAQPVLALLPQSKLQPVQDPTLGPALKQEGGISISPDKALQVFQRPMVLATIALLGLALLLALVPGLWQRLTAGSEVAPGTDGTTLADSATPIAAPIPAPAVVPAVTAVEASIAPATASATSVGNAPDNATAAGAFASTANGAAAAASAPIASLAPAQPAAAITPNTSGNVVQLLASAESWVRITDSKRRVLASQTLNAGDHLQVEGRPPFRLVVGRAESVQVSYLGQTVAYPATMQSGAARFNLPQ